MKKRAYYAFKDTVFFIACLHLLLLLIHAVTTGQFVYINPANILDLQLYFKELSYSPLVGIIGSLIVLILFGYNYSKTKEK